MGTKCTKCDQYSYSLRRCKLGKINPKTIKGGLDAARLMGMGYICSKCSLYDKILEKLFTK